MNIMRELFSGTTQYVETPKYPNENVLKRAKLIMDSDAVMCFGQSPPYTIVFSWR